jgi:hypothetical protein
VIKKLPIRSSWLNLTGEPTEVEVPSIESILGDKLRAFAPNTTGVLYGKNKSLEIVKQLHDVGHLFDHVNDVRTIAESFDALVVQEIQYRNLEVTADHVLDDIIETALLIGKTEKYHERDEIAKYNEIRGGLYQFGTFLMTGNFYIETAIESAAKAAYLAAKLRVRNHSNLEYPTEEEISFQFKTIPYNSLNRLRKMRNRSLFYWSKAAELLGFK